MCGIVGAISQRDVGKLLLEGLKRLEYRGYDSAGISMINHQGQLCRLRTQGRVAKLLESFEKNPIAGTLGISHTRWATHGIPHERNAHPHQSGDDIAVVHNGIVENFETLRDQLFQSGYIFHSETDTETIAHLMHCEFQKTDDFLKAAKNVAGQLKGAFALGIINVKDPDRLIAVRCGSPLVVGIGIEENFLASDPIALVGVTQQFIFLEDGDIADVKRDKITIYDKHGKEITRDIHISELTYDSASLGEYRHFMLKEIFEQPEALRTTLGCSLNENDVSPDAFGVESKACLEKTSHVTIVACGTSHHAAMIARYWIEELAHIPCQVEIASEFRYRHVIVQPNTLFVTISQSGETADTLAALRLAKEMDYLGALTICNVPASSLVRESDFAFITRAGVEVGVASTKAFTTQLLGLLLLAVTLARSTIDKKQRAKLIQLLRELPDEIDEVLKLSERIRELADLFANKQHALFLGRGLQYPVALEGALKLKEISYIHAEGYPAGELKHGPLALVDKNMPVIAVAPSNDLLEKLKSNLQEVRARGGQLIVFADTQSGIKNGDDIITIEMPKVDNLIAPIVYTVPLQLLSYYVALIKGTDVDHPRNLAKSVTVE
ncbi:MAG: glutamine--fructose-6-phosphate aminotransferase [Gammaproteobacteria bacterium RIFCSPHIGHO2_02_FULL_42_13]|nr:MAG: glutamine--fructose-6-phosphate aminotransferase [Gammaproteobacteria bacterium RIFCSPHIGHO2_02_FULL_42_13]OGT68485.1 MAG: glutamine--fructose-6-phosphate aminotransferase [Gammaproteobacteria bacterium RIFCSPLOWO2_02_FULL_42_9]